MSITARFCHILVNLQDAGVSLIQSLDILEAIFDNDYLTTKFRAIKKEIAEGKGLGESFDRQEFFRQLFKWSPLVNNLGDFRKCYHR